MDPSARAAPSTMITKFETKSNRVKGLSFHPSRPWILASLHIGIIQFWDYRMGTLLERFDEHEGPVRGVSFHLAQPLFVSGGDDYKVKVWNYKMRRCLFTLVGHLDFIRTVQFHNENPWILSASDDQTIRIWNWQARNCISVLTGHNHYVMCAQFHPKLDLAVSASLDQTVRVWDLAGLRTKSGPRSLEPQQSDLFGGSEATVKYVLEGHERGVNWASFHHTLPLIVSGADDRQIKLWRHNESRAWEVDKFHGHFNNVSCVLFHPRKDLFISNAEDKCIRVWDIQKRSCVHLFRREHDRFWILAAHPVFNLFAAGHDSGMIVFKLERERPGYTVYKDTLFYIKDRYIRTYEFSTSRDIPIVPIRRPASATGPPRSVSYNPAERAVIITWDEGGGTYELYHFPSDPSSRMEVECKRGAGLAAVFVARNRFAVLDASRTILIKSLDNAVRKRCVPPHPSTDFIFYAGTGCLFLRSEGKITLYDIQRKAAMKELTVPKVKYVYWSKDMSHVALLCKHSIVLCTRKLKQLGTVHETIRVKSGAWNDAGVFIYTTLNHIKYALPNGDSGIIRTLSVPVYITKTRGNVVYALDREGKNRVISIDSTEFAFKLALINRDYAEVRRIIESARLLGKSIVAYLQRKGFPEVALYFVKDPNTRFSLALECGNIEVALECAKTVESVDMWQQLAVEALRQGNHQVVEMSYQRTMSFAKLSFLYLITGNLVKLNKMLQISAMRNDTMGRFHNALYTGSAQDRVKVLYDAGQFQLAYAAAVAHGLTDDADAIRTALGPDNIPAGLDEFLVENGKLLLPPVPLMKLHESNWPLLTRSRGYFDGAGITDAASIGGVVIDDDDSDGAAGGWGSSSDADAPDGTDPAAAGNDGDDSAGSGWGSDSDLDIPVEELAAATAGAVSSVPGATGGPYVPPPPGQPVSAGWTTSTLAVDHVAAGSFESAMQLLVRQIAVGDFGPLLPAFRRVFLGSQAAVTAFSLSQPLAAPLVADWEHATPKTAQPLVAISMASLITSLQAAYSATTKGKFPAAVELFRGILAQLPLVKAATKAEEAEARQLLGICVQYITGLSMEILRKAAKGDLPRALALMAYFTHCKLETAHMRLALEMAMKGAYKAKNFGMAASFCQRLLALSPKPKVAQKATQVHQVCSKNPTNAVDVDYQEFNPFVMCCATYTPIYAGSPSATCGYCAAAYKPDLAGSICTVCLIGKVGAQGAGLVLRAGR
ncbi:coatomer protein complex [Thecamonas trahens ATCC 50062]|uniref:Coatomer subunit alpha n=1 Tax=Thecamonas trahens ATCC 50062 TaxID=461836 RepID=A0A0L0DNH5_THETB|nr:coatomer protein complex [Thecamonas trahens ATCC 50062]KNC53867.1 coatomer protein complex [Thecamonas trahens ATCC 50062]|eukprot:XP_013754247.1 coatomer protein complex [Thecamonas trahens ATCC 50062]